LKHIETHGDDWGSTILRSHHILIHHDKPPAFESIFSDGNGLATFQMSLRPHIPSPALMAGVLKLTLVETEVEVPRDV
jgi:hypothetical protein